MVHQQIAEKAACVCVHLRSHVLYCKHLMHSCVQLPASVLMEQMAMLLAPGVQLGRCLQGQVGPDGVPAAVAPALPKRTTPAAERIKQQQEPSYQISPYRCICCTPSTKASLLQSLAACAPLKSHDSVFQSQNAVLWHLQAPSVCIQTSKWAWAQGQQ